MRKMNIAKQIGSLLALPNAAIRAGMARQKAKQVAYDADKQAKVANNKKMGPLYSSKAARAKVSNAADKIFNGTL